MSLEERTLVVRGFDEEYVSQNLLRELFNNFGPVVKIVMRKDHAFIEFKDRDSVAYSFAMVEGVHINKCTLRCSPRIENDFYYQFVDRLRKFNDDMHSSNYQNRYLNSQQRSSIKNAKQKTKEMLSRSKAYSRHFPMLKALENPYLRTNLFDDEKRYRSQSSSRARHDRRRSPSPRGSSRRSRSQQHSKNEQYSRYERSGGWQTGVPRQERQESFGYPVQHPPPPSSSFGYPVVPNQPNYPGGYGMPNQGHPPPPPPHYQGPPPPPLPPHHQGPPPPPPHYQQPYHGPPPPFRGPPPSRRYR